MAKRLIIILSALVSFAIYAFLPIDKDVLKGLCILLFIAALWLTEALPITITALIAPLLAVLTGVLNVKDALSYFAHPVIFLFLGGYGLAAALHKYNLDGLFAGQIMRAAGNRMIYSVLGLFVSTALLSMWISNTATTAIMLPVALGMIESMKEKNQVNDMFILLGVAYSANIGGIGTLIGSPPNAITAANLGLTFTDWLSIGLPAVFVLFPVMIAVIYFKLRPRLPDVTTTRKISADIVFSNPKSYWVVIIFIVTVLFWLFSNPISGLMGVDKYMDSVIAVLAIVLLVSFGTVSWKEIEHFADWGVLLLFGGGLVLTGVLSQTGASSYLAGLIETELSMYGLFIIILCTVTLMIILTEFASNTASAAVMVPILLTLGQQLNLSSPGVLAISAGLAASCAFMLPVATPPNALVFGTNRIKQRAMIKIGFLLNIVSVLIISALTYFLL